MGKKKNSEYHVPNLERALEILELLASHPAGLTVAQICEMLHIPRNSVFRITSTLFNYEYLTRDEETKEFRVSYKLLTIGYSALGEEGLVEKALPIMRELRNKIGETVPLGIIHGNEGLVIVEVPGVHSFRFVLEPGRKFHLHTSAPGKAILAFMPQAEKENIFKNMVFTKYNEKTITNLSDYQKHLNVVKECHYAVDDAEEVDGMHCVAAPIFNYRGFPTAAIWITGPSARIKKEDYDKIGKEIKRHADRISKSLGYDPSRKQ